MPYSGPYDMSARAGPDRLTAQTGRVGAVSGATVIPAGYIKSLQSALDQARAYPPTGRPRAWAPAQILAATAVQSRWPGVFVVRGKHTLGCTEGAFP
jgi:hypothetical protein